MAKITLKKIFYWFIGETAGRSAVGIWKWLWGIPVEPGGKIAEKVAQESLQSMQQSVVQLSEAVARVVAAYQQAQEKYRKKQEEYHQAERQAQIAYRQGNEEAARLALTKAIVIEKILPQLQQQVAKAETLMIAAKEKLNREREKVETYSLEMGNLQALSEMNQAMKDIFNITTELDIENARSQFTEAQNAIEGKYLRENAKAELADNDLSGFGSYIFRTVPKIRYMTDALAEYLVKTARKTKVAVCYDSKAPDNVSAKDEFVASLLAQEGKLAPTVCDFATPNFDANLAIADAVSSGADSLFIAPHIDRLNQAIDLARANRGKLALLSTPTLYTIKTLQSGQEDFKGLVLPVPWHPQATPAAKTFAAQAQQLWKAEITIWRTATAFDATRAVIVGLQSSRVQLQAALKSPNFVAPGGANGDVRFLPTGDRLGKAVLMQVKSTAAGYEFVPIQAQER